MAVANVEVTTQLTIQETAEIFRRSMRVTWLSEVMGRGTTFEKPPPDEAFGELEQDRPTFEVMATLGGSGEEINRSAVFMFIWDRGSDRLIRLTQGNALLALGIKGKQKIRRFVHALEAADPRVQYSGL